MSGFYFFRKKFTVAAFVDLTSKTFGQWYVIERAPRRPKVKNSLWLCQCSCGNQRIVFAHLLRSGNSTHCSPCSVRLGVGIHGFTPKQRKAVASKAGKGHVKSGHWGKVMPLGNHTRWHTNRGIKNPRCLNCKDES